MSDGLGNLGVRAFVALLLATMLLKAEAAGLADQRINQGVKQAMASLADNRPVVLAKAAYATFGPATALDSPPIMSFTFPPATLAIGDQIHIVVTGILTNGSAGIYSVGYVASIVGAGGTILRLGSPATVPNAGPGADVAFWTDISIAVSTPNASGVYIPATGINPNASGSQLRQNVPNTAIAFTGSGRTLIGSGNTFGPMLGGFILAPAGGPGSELFSIKFQQIFDSSQPIRFDVVSTAGQSPTGATSYVSVESGVMMGM